MQTQNNESDKHSFFLNHFLNDTDIPVYKIIN